MTDIVDFDVYKKILNDKNDIKSMFTKHPMSDIRQAFNFALQEDSVIKLRDKLTELETNLVFHTVINKCHTSDRMIEFINEEIQNTRKRFKEEIIKHMKKDLEPNE